MRLEQSFELPVPVDQAWRVLLDLERVAPCVPGATLTSFDGTSFTGLVALKLGSLSVSMRGGGRFAERDDDGKRLVVVAQGQDTQGLGSGTVRLTAVLHKAGAGTTTVVKVVADLDLTGRVARVDRGLIGDVSGGLVKQFAQCLARNAMAKAAVPAAENATAVETAAVPQRVAAAPSVVGLDVETIPSQPVAVVDIADVLPSAQPAAPSQPGAADAPAATATAGPITAQEVAELLAVSGGPSLMRRVTPYLVGIGVVVVGLIVWMLTR